jgi:hypothetical protein
MPYTLEGATKIEEEEKERRRNEPKIYYHFPLWALY